MTYGKRLKNYTFPNKRGETQPREGEAMKTLYAGIDLHACKQQNVVVVADKDEAVVYCVPILPQNPHGPQIPYKGPRVTNGSQNGLTVRRGCCMMQRVVKAKLPRGFVIV